MIQVTLLLEISACMFSLNNSMQKMLDISKSCNTAVSNCPDWYERLRCKVN